MDVREIKTQVQQLEKVKDDRTTIQILTILKKDIKPTEKLLRETRVGIAVNKFKTSPNPEISGLVKKIIKFWKDEVAKEKKSKSVSSSSPPAPNPPASTNQAQQQPQQPQPQPQQSSNSSSTNTNGSGKFESKGPRSAAEDGVKTDLYENTTRNNAIKTIYNGLCMDTDKLPGAILKICKEIESEVFSLVKFDTKDKFYRSKLITLSSNIRQKNNPELRWRLVTSDLSPKEFVSMDPKEYAPESLKIMLQDIKARNLHNAVGATQERAVTDRFTCGKCKEKKVSYYQLQTRSADEPLTTFCTCENCGNRWRFS